MKKNWYMTGNPWTLEQTVYDPADALYYETVMTQSNGHIGIRGYSEEVNLDEKSCREGLCAGIFYTIGGKVAEYNKSKTPKLENAVFPEIFNCTATLGGEVFSLETGKIQSYSRSLDMRSGLLVRTIMWKSPGGLISELTFERFVSVDQYQLAAQRVSVKPINWNGGVIVDFKCDGERQSRYNHWIPELVGFQNPFVALKSESKNQGSVLSLQTTGTKHSIAIASVVSDTVSPVDGGKNWLWQKVEKPVAKNKLFCVERVLSVVTSRDPDGAATPQAHALKLAQAGAKSGFDALLKKSAAIWKSRWKNADIVITGNDHDQKVARFNVFHLMQMAPYHTDRVSIGARGLSINRYSGQYFWDTEAFLLPFYSSVTPEVARNLLTFRHHTLPGAKIKAAKAGFKGAAFPWITDSVNGLEQMGGEHEKVLWHQTAAIGYALDQYLRVSGDTSFLSGAGIDILVETARFWSTRVELEKDGLYHMDHCIGPDETNSDGKDNGYTNLMAKRHLSIAVQWVTFMQNKMAAQWATVRSRLKIAPKELILWDTVAKNLIVPLVPNSPLEIPLQDEVLLGKKDAKMKEWRLREEMSQWKLTWQERRAYKLIKQADIILAMFMLRDQYSTKQLKAAFDLYEPITQHVSSLSYNTYAMVATHIGRAKMAYDYYQFAACLDIDNRKLAAHDGLHAAALGGTWQAITMGFGGMNIAQDKLTFDPRLPKQWKSLSFTVVHLGKSKKVTISGDGKVRVVEGKKAK